MLPLNGCSTNRPELSAARLPSAPYLRFTRHVKITELTDQLIASYASVGGINHLDGTNLPSSGIVGLTTDLLALLFRVFR